MLYLFKTTSDTKIKDSNIIINSVHEAIKITMEQVILLNNFMFSFWW